MWLLCSLSTINRNLRSLQLASVSILLGQLFVFFAFFSRYGYRLLTDEIALAAAFTVLAWGAPSLGRGRPVV